MKTKRQQPDVILVDSDQFIPTGEETQRDCDAALERLLARVQATWPEAAIICQPEHLWQTFLAMRPDSWQEVARPIPESWYEASW